MRTLLAAFILILRCGVAQEVPLQGPATGDPNANSSTPKTYQGCVIRANGNVMLTDASNRDYRLVSSARKLDSYVGQEVKITATAINPDDPSSGERGVNSGKPPNQPPALDVEDIEKLADHCSSPK